MNPEKDETLPPQNPSGEEEEEKELEDQDEEEGEPLERSQWELPDKEKFDPADYGGSPFGGSNRTLPPNPDGFW